MCATKSTEEVEIHGFLADQRGTDFLGYKTSTIRRRLNEQMHKAGRTSHTRYMELLRADPVECDRLLDRLTISVSTFFRNPLVWQTLRDRVMPEILEKGDLAGRRVIRVWSAGCAQGEEAYSAAILHQQILGGGGGRRLVGSD